jgi:hypothetical protein
LFDDVDDDEYDGEFREDDEELPMMHVSLILAPKTAAPVQ